MSKRFTLDFKTAHVACENDLKDKNIHDTLHFARKKLEYLDTIFSSKRFENDSLRPRANARNIHFRISLHWPIHIINPADKTKLSCNTPQSLPTQHHSFFRNLPLLFSSRFTVSLELYSPVKNCSPLGIRSISPSSRWYASVGIDNVRGQEHVVFLIQPLFIAG